MDTYSDSNYLKQNQMSLQKAKPFIYTIVQKK